MLAARVVPMTAMINAVHISVAAVNRMDYLLTWNCTHMANAAIRGKIEKVIGTPEELMEA